MKRSFLYCIGLIAAVGLQGCNSEPPARPGALNKGQVYNGDAKNGIPNGTLDPGKPINPAEPALLYDIGAISQDALDFTFGVATLAPVGAISKDVVIKRFVKVSDPTKLSTEQQTELSTLCRDLGVSETSAQLAEAKDSGSTTEPLHVVWRSNYKSSLKFLLSELVTAGQKEILCVLKIEAKDDPKIQPFYLTFDPLPNNAALAKGSAQLAKAMENGLLLPLQRGRIAFDDTKMIAVAPVADLKLAVPALKKEDITLAPSKDPIPSCLLDPSKGAAALMNPKAPLFSKFTVESKTETELAQVIVRPVDGRVLKSCANVKTAFKDKAVEAGLDCSTYQAIKDEGIEAGCQWDVEIANAKDKDNTVTVRMNMNKTTFQAFDIRKVDASLAGIPKAANNPVRTKSITFTGFSPGQLGSMEQMFDLWIATEPKSYLADVNGYMKRINVEDCSPGILGFAGLGSAEFTICLLASLRDNDLTKTNDPVRPIIQLITTAHEVRHAVKWGHDTDNPSYKPCEASAASAVTMQAIVATCSLDYCLVLKNMATREYISELVYSLQGDNRRFQGQCKEWSDSMGITDNDLR